ncbi:hypothetical protein [Belliella aquatica]|uniref:Uncharacterized protein n=1 Tax=Belliella aquatica TaxID=1323734 RepID=A0ABQ1MBA6_9BACT|nr:hypothetical protein [Belliella aquatica]MCH7406323.1 hypothetical protein [Belliella aquatica]GGC37861.1 hypothetical protein GCM10010993_15950 [Belliella aquatica]
MNQLRLLVFFIIGMGTLLSSSGSVFGNTYRMKSCSLTDIDTLFTQVFQNESDFDWYIGEELQLFNSNETLAKIEDAERDSLYQLFNEKKQISIDKKDLWKFLGFTIEDPDLQQIISQSVDILPKSKIQTFDFEINAGDRVFFNYSSIVNKGSAIQIEILLNKVSIEKSMSVKKGKKIELDFIAKQAGKVEVIIKSFSILRHEGFLDIQVKAKKENILLQQIQQPITQLKLVNTMVFDTLFETVLDEDIRLTHKLNIVETASFEKEILFNKDKELIGFSIFFFPSEQKEKLRFERKEIWREDPFQDFSIKELTGRSFTYLPEFSFPELDIWITNQEKEKVWLNGQSLIKEDDWEPSQNSKRNYAMFSPSNIGDDRKIYLKMTNKSTLYDFNLSIRILALFRQRFSVLQEVEVKSSVEKILLSLI